jgi:6-phosphofructokinase
MDLVPSEKAVLHTIRALMQESKSRAYLVTILRSRWPVLHVQAYDSGYRGLIDKRLIELSADQRTFSVTSAGLACLGQRAATA